ncbi:MAG: sigma-70 family RNA polymerase sigma factor [Caulobacteraceae bacterium]|nr:sigma-70 family RNA polymerase sigma factor [Caulobacteraceae bacterium]
MNDSNDRYPDRGYYTGQGIESQRLSVEQEQALFGRLVQDRSNPRIRDEVARAFIGFALRQAKKDIANRTASVRSKAGLSEDDAISAANFGLMTAIDRFDPCRGVRFTTYAGWWIKKALHEARYAAHVVSVPRGDRERFVLFRRQQADGLTVAQIAEFNGLDIPEVERVLALASGRQDPIEMFDRGETNDAFALHEILQNSPLEGLEQEEMLERLEHAKNRLGHSDLRLLHDRFSRSLSIKALAAKNQCTTRTVENRLSAILCVLRLNLNSS